MSLKNIGELGKYANELKDFSHLSDFLRAGGKNDGFNAIRDSLDGLSVDEATKKLQGLKLNPELTAELLEAANNGKLLKGSADEIADGIEKVGKSSSFVDDLGLAFKGLWMKMKPVLVGLASNPLTWIIGASAAIIAVYDIFNTSVGEHEEKLANLKSEYSSFDSELNSLNSELKTTTDRMSELENKDSLTFTEQEEYDNLVKTNNELQRTIDLLEIEAKKKAEAINKEFVDTMGADLDDVSGEHVTSKQNSDGTVTNSYISEKDFINEQFEELEKLRNDKANATTVAEKKRIQKQIDTIENYFKDKNSEFSNRIEGVEYIKNPTNEDDEKVNAWLDYINDFQDRMAIAYGSENAKTNSFNRLVDNWQFDDTVQGLQDFGRTGEVTAQMLNDPIYDDFINKLVELGIINSADNLDAIADAFNNASESATKATSEINNVKSAIDTLSGVQSLSDGLDQLSDIFNDVKDGGSFDFSAILNNEDFANAFSAYEEEYNNFIETITKSPNDIDACQESFNNLATAYIYGSGVLSDLTEETKESTIAMLEQMGVFNAEEVVKEAIEIKENFDNVTEAFNKTKLALVSMDNASEVVEQLDNLGIQNAQEIVDGVIDTKEAYDELRDSYKGTKIAKEELANTSLEDSTDKTISALTLEDGKLNETEANIVSLWMETQIANGNHLTTDGNIANLQAMCDALGITISRIGDYGRAIKTLRWMEENKDMIGQDSFDSLNRYIASLESNISVQFRAGVGKKSNTTNIKYGGGSLSNKDSGSDKETEETFDWIKTKLQRLQREIENLGQTADASYKLWSERNTALAKEMSKVTDEITLQRQAYNAYMKEANAVGLSSTYQNLVKNGGLKIDTIKDEALVDKIKKFQEFYDKALECEDAIQDLNDELANLARQKFDNISAEFDNLMSGIEHELNMLDAYVSQTEARGRFVSTKYYSSMIALEKQNIGLLENEYSKLTASLNEAVNSGQIQKYSEEWYNMAGEINSVSEELVEANTSVIEFQNNIRELEWEVFDKLQEFISQIQGESEFLQELMSDEKMFSDEGSITEHGRATLGLHAVNYETYMRQANDYAEELKKINADIAEDPNNLTLLERRQELLESQRDMILAAEDEKQAMKDLISEGYDTFLNYMQELIDKRKEAMQSIKDMYDYEKNVSEQTDEIARLQKIIDSYGGDTSEETKAALQQYKVQLEDAEQALEETEYEKYLSDQEQMLDEMYSETEEWINQRLDNLDGLVQGVIDSTNNNAESIKDTLVSETEKVGMTLTDEMNNIWSIEGSAGKVVAMYGDSFNSHLTTISTTLSGIKDYIGSMVKESDKEASSDIDKTQSQNATNPSTSSGGSATPSTPPSTTNPPSSGSTSSSTGSSDKWGSWFISKKNYVSKSKLKKDSSIVDFNESTLNTLNCGKTLRA